jgi:nicotinamide-nucleotide amidase
MRAVILAIGSELVGTDRLDTNSLRLTEQLRAFGVELAWKACLPDDEAAIARALRRALRDAELVLVCGGLGPTADDVTREGVARSLRRPMARDAAIEQAIAERFARFGLRMPEVNAKQAMVIDGATVLENRRGTAPGLRLAVDDRTVFLLPGVPAELDGLVESSVLPWLREKTGGELALETSGLRVACLPESEVEARIQPAYGEFGRHDITVLASTADVRVRVCARGDGPARRARLAAMRERLAELLGEAVYTLEESETLEEVVGRLLKDRGASVATAESCTGGLVAERLTRVAGSSDYFRGGLVVYSNEAKVRLAGVSPAILAEHGAVSLEVASALAEGALERFASDTAIGITGIAGPGGATPGKPVGTVCFALASRSVRSLGSQRLQLRLPGDRARVRSASSQVALDMLRRFLLGLPLSWNAAS